MGAYPPASLPLLCSASPRRAALLATAGVPFELGDPPAVDETPPPHLSPEDAARALAERKAVAAASRRPRRRVIAADTVVIVDGAILGKPVDAADARRMLALLSGRSHRVATGVAVARGTTVLSGLDVATVTFRALSADEIDGYVATGEPLDKAGAYAIQGGAKGFVSRLDGAVDTVVGLPVALTKALLSRLGSAPGGALSDDGG